MVTTRVAWLRRDLRVHDAPALLGALDPDDDDARVVALFVLDPRLLDAPTVSPAALSYLCDALADLDAGLRDRGGRLVVRHGDARQLVPAVTAEVKAEAVHWCHDVTPFARTRDAAVRAALEDAGVGVGEHGGTMIHDHGTVLAGSGRPSKVYTPFRKAWERLGLSAPREGPERIPAHGSVRSDDLPTVEGLGVADRVPPDVIGGGETQANRRLDRFLEERADGYADGRERMGADGTSRISADLHYGCLSPRAVYARLDRRNSGHKAFGQELVWRDFYGHVMAEWPHARTEAFNADYADLPWHGEGDAFDAWREGRTGYPVVDAGMRQLLVQGWMHNRARMVVASFLCKDLLVDWRLGERHFLAHLVDGDVASNNGGWQWAAGSGTDAQPFFRVFNPVTQGQRFDPDGDYVRAFVPELRPVPTKWVHQPWEMPDDVAREAGVTLGEDYPLPVVDHKQARSEALAWFSEHRR